jgi:hypothetical protein
MLWTAPPPARRCRAGFTVVVAADGAQGIAMATSELPDLILMDLTLPDIPREPIFQHVDVIVIVFDVENLHACLTVCNLTHLLISRVSCRSISPRSLF